MRVKLFDLALVFSFVSSGFASTLATKNSLARLARKAASANASESGEAIAALRAEGPAGLEAFLSEHATELKNRRLELAAPTRQTAP